MRVSDKEIGRYLKTYKDFSHRESGLQETIRKSKAAFSENEAESYLFGAEFVYQQSKYIRKRWWILQGSVLLLLWTFLEVTESSFCVRKSMGIGASMFAVLLLPELWKNRSAEAMEIEGAAFYSLQQVYAARIFLFAIVDFLFLCSFSMVTVLSGKMLIEEIIIQFFLPYAVTCCICFRTLYSRRVASETFALLLCIIWCGVWTQIVLNEKIYETISLPVWCAVFAAAVLYLGYCIYRGQKNCKELWEANPLWS